MRFIIASIFFLFTALFNVTGQAGHIRGRIADSITKEPLAGVAIFYGKHIGTTSDSSGYYSLSTSQGKLNLIFQFIGYDPVIKEVYRVLKKGGVFIYDEFARGPRTKEQLEKKLRSKLVPDYLRKYRKEGVEIWNIRYLQEHIGLLEKMHFKVEKVIETKVDDEIKELSTNYEIHKGRPFAEVIMARK